VGLAIVAAPPRASAHDVVVGELRPGARVGTASLRRQAQLLAAEPELEVVELRGNVDTRLRKLADGQADAIVLAAAGLERLGRADVATQALTGPLFVPAAGQGTLAVEARAGDERFAAVDDPRARRELEAERAAVRVLGADCHTPVGVHAEALDDGRLRLRGFAGLPDGSAWVCDEVVATDGETLAERMLAGGAGPLLDRARAA
jgi:hydroxymethylbilane synthase